MAKTPTNWSNNDVKTPQTWGNGSVKSTPSWSNNIVKAVTTYTPVSKNVNSWSNEFMQLTPYTYDSATVTYDNAFTYDYLQMVTNTTNNKNVTGWSS